VPGIATSVVLSRWSGHASGTSSDPNLW